MSNIFGKSIESLEIMILNKYKRTMFEIILSSLYFILPAYIANAAPVLVKRINFLNYSIDFNKKISGLPILGKNKTWRGLIFGILSSIIVIFIQYILYDVNTFFEISLIDYKSVNFVLLGFLFGFGALFGDMVESLIKRRLNIKSGGPFFPFDQLDFIVGALLFVGFVFFPPITTIVVLFIFTPLIHLLTNIIAYKLKMKDVWW